MMRCAVFLPMPGTPEIVATSSRRDGSRQRVGREGRQRGERDLRTHARHRDELLERRLLGLALEAEERQLVLADVQVRVHHDLVADGGQRGQRAGRHGETVADAADLEKAVAGALGSDRAGEERDHAPSLSSARLSRRCACVIAAASASAAWSGLGS